MDALKAIGKSLAATPVRQQEADSDWEIVQRVQTGDVAAFDELTLRYRGRVFGMIYNMTSNREDASDLTQDAFIKAFQSINRFQGQSSFFTWLYRIAVNSTLTHLRKNRLRTFFSLEKVDENDRQSAEVIEALTDNSGVERDTYVKELQERLNEAMQKLSIKHRTVVTLFEIDGL
ncbi:MAG: sigma-70 family RNA polymerase sigma factor, partial [Cephaloticoccus sp.]|nr:sigma-70 family RNA polymerase sigma factor [Cephaloticoccus sp.]